MTTKISPAEISFLRDSLIQSPPIRPDARSPTQFRPIDATFNFLPSSNGSARIRSADGSECIVSIKSQVVSKSKEPSLVQVDVDISGQRDDSVLCSTLSSTLQSMILSTFSTEVLSLTSKYSFKLYIDALIISPRSHPLSVLSLATYLALKTTRLPLLISSSNDTETPELPTFSDDWAESKQLVSNDNELSPPLLFVVGIVGDNIFLDPTLEEQIVTEAGLLLGWSNGTVVSPIKTINLGGKVSKGLKPKHISAAIKLIQESGASLAKALDAVAKEESDKIF